MSALLSWARDRLRRLPLPFLVGAGAALLMAAQLLLPPGVGLADNGEGNRLACRISVAASPPEGTPRYFDFVVTKWSPQNWRPTDCSVAAGNRTPSSQLLLLRAAKAVTGHVGLGPGLDLRLLALLCSATVGLLIGGLFAVLPGRLLARGLVAAGTGLVLADPAVGAFFLSMYPEPVAILAVLGLVVAWLAPGRRRWQVWARTWGVVGAALLLVTASEATLLLALPIGAALVVRGRAVSPVGAGQVARIAGALGCATVIVLAGFQQLRMQPRASDEVAAYDAVFATLLGHSSDVAGDLGALGAPVELAPAAGSTYYQPRNALAAPAYAEFREGFSWLRLARFYATRPGRLFGLYQRSAYATATLRPKELGNRWAGDGIRPRSLSCRGCTVSLLVPGVRGAAWLLLPVFWLAALRVGVLLARRSGPAGAPEWRPLGEVVIVVVACAVTEFLTVMFLYGDVNAVRQHAVSGLLTALLLPLGGAAIYGLFALARDDEEVEGPEPTGPLHPWEASLAMPEAEGPVPVPLAGNAPAPMRAVDVRRSSFGALQVRPVDVGLRPWPSLSGFRAHRPTGQGDGPSPHGATSRRT